MTEAETLILIIASTVNLGLLLSLNGDNKFVKHYVSYRKHNDYLICFVLLAVLNRSVPDLCADFEDEAYLQFLRFC